MATKRTKENPFQKATDKGKKQQAEAIGEPSLEEQVPKAEPIDQQPASESEKVGLNLRIPKDKRQYLKSWCALRAVPMNDLICLIIDQMKAGTYDPLAK